MNSEIVTINGVDCLYNDIGDGNINVNIGSTEKVIPVGLHLLAYSNGYYSVLKVITTETHRRLTIYNSELSELITDDLSPEEIFQYSLVYPHFDILYAAKELIHERTESKKNPAS